jgi:hypothetical protein
MRVINNSLPESYFSQRNNRRSPYSACNVTAMVDATAAAGWPIPEPKDGEDQQPEDRLMLFIETDQECRQMWATLDPRMEIPINQWMAVLTLGLNRWMGQIISLWTESATIPRMIGQLMQGGTCVVSGTFPRVGGHVVAIVGLEYEESDLGDPVPHNWIIDDPYGDYRTNYESERGDDVRMPHDTFLAVLKPTNAPRKWCHFIRPYRADGRTT